MVISGIEAYHQILTDNQRPGYNLYYFDNFLHSPGQQLKRFSVLELEFGLTSMTLRQRIATSIEVTQFNCVLRHKLIFDVTLILAFFIKVMRFYIKGILIKLYFYRFLGVTYFC